MKSITLSADGRVIEQAREASGCSPMCGPTMRWSEALKKTLRYVRAGRKFTREEINEP
jgi:hypothetical protein